MNPTPGQPSKSPNNDVLAALLLDDTRFEPPATAVEAAKALGALLTARASPRSGTGAMQRLQTQLTSIGAVFDRAGSVIGAWVISGTTSGPESNEARLAFAGLRDDATSGLCADTLHADLVESDLILDAERTRGQDGVVRLIGEIRERDGSLARASIVVLDESARVLDVVDSDDLGLFSVKLAENAAELAVRPQARDPQGSKSLLPTTVLPLAWRNVT